MTSPSSADATARFLRPVLGLCLVCMTLVFLYQLADGPGLTVRPAHNHPEGVPVPAQAFAPDAPENSLPPGEEAELTRLMGELQAAPTDIPTLLAIADLFSRNKDYARADTFLIRAAAAAPNDMRPPYFQGLNFTRSGNYSAAEKAFARASSLEQGSSAAYSLAILYKYHLRQPEKASELFQTLLASPHTVPAIRERVQRELEKQ